MLNFTAQHKLGILQRLIVQQPVQFRPLCRVSEPMAADLGALEQFVAGI